MKDCFRLFVGSKVIEPSLEIASCLVPRKWNNFVFFVVPIVSPRILPDTTQEVISNKEAGLIHLELWMDSAPSRFCELVEEGQCFDVLRSGNPFPNALSCNGVLRVKRGAD